MFGIKKPLPKCAGWYRRSNDPNMLVVTTLVSTCCQAREPRDSHFKYLRQFLNIHLLVVMVDDLANGASEVAKWRLNVEYSRRFHLDCLFLRIHNYFFFVLKWNATMVAPLQLKVYYKTSLLPICNFATFGFFTL